MKSSRGKMRRSVGAKGFSLVELLVVMAISSILLTLGANAVRHYWLVRSLEGGADEVVTHLRRQQERSVSESHPKIFGVRFREGSASWALVRFDPVPDPDTCTEVGPRRFDSGVIISSDGAATSFAAGNSDGLDITAYCRSQPGWAADEFVFFYPRGTATAGNVTLFHPLLNRSEQITVLGLTGRVDRT